MTIATPTADRQSIAGRHAARYARATILCARHALSDDYSPRHADKIDTAARMAAHRAAEHGAYSPLIDRLERLLNIDADEDTDE